jgi:Family of unknown function (DUF5977)
VASNAYTLGDLVAELQPILWPDGEAQNLVIPHHSLFIEALIDIQQWVECQQINNTQIVPQCNTLFNCGLTVTDAPRGRIRRVYTIDHINQTTGQEDNTVPLDWCSEVEYRQVDYSDLSRYISQTLANTLDGGFFGWLGGFFGGAFPIAFPALCSTWNNKYAYPPPTDAGLTGAPPLPMGFHYPQSSTDARGRALFGLWAMKGGQIFVAPWIQSTEVLVIEWDGLKRTWSDDDLVDNDPILKKAVQAYVLSEHQRKYDHDFAAAEGSMAVYATELSKLIYNCREENAIREANQSSMARGSSTVVPTYTNTAQTATASCPNGTVGQAVTVTVAAGTVQSFVSVADANSMAASQALQQAGSQLQCTTPQQTWTNTVQTFTANCVGGTGNPVTVTVAAGTFTSTVSQADANTQALNSATASANSQLSCNYGNVSTPYTAACSNGSNSTTITIAANTYFASSQVAANAMALQAATNQVNTILSGLCSTPLFYNSLPYQETYTLQCTVINRNGIVITQPVIGFGVVNIHEVTSTVSQAEAESIAYNKALNLAQNQALAECRAAGGNQS